MDFCIFLSDYLHCYLYLLIYLRLLEPHSDTIELLFGGGGHRHHHHQDGGAVTITTNRVGRSPSPPRGVVVAITTSLYI